MNILVTGGAGFVGSHIANRLAKEHTVLAVDNLKFGYADNLSHDVQFIRCGFEDLADIYFSYFDIIIHAACDNIIYAMDDPVGTFETNALKSIQLFKKFNGKIIYTSTSSVYGSADFFPTTERGDIKLRNAYDTSKYLAELFLEERGNFTTLRLSNVYGPRQRADNPYSGVIGKFMDAAVTGDRVTVFGSGDDTRDYTYVADVADAVECAIKLPATECAVNISGNCELSVNELIEVIGDVTGKELYTSRKDGRKIDGIKRRWLDCSLAYSLLDWEAKTDMTEGLTKTLEYVQDNRKKREDVSTAVR